MFKIRSSDNESTGHVNIEAWLLGFLRCKSFHKSFDSIFMVRICTVWYLAHVVSSRDSPPIEGLMTSLLRRNQYNVRFLCLLLQQLSIVNYSVYEPSLGILTCDSSTFFSLSRRRHAISYSGWARTKYPHQCILSLRVYNTVSRGSCMNC